MAEAMAPGANISEIARAHGLSPQQVFAWRRQAVRAAEVGEDAGTVELVVGDVVIRIGPAVTIARLQAILRAVRSA